MLNSSVGAIGEWLSTGGGVASCKSCVVSPEAPPVRRLFTLLSPTCRVPQRSAETVFFCYWLISLTCSLLVPRPETYGNSQSKLMSHPCFGLTILCRGTWTCFQVYVGPCSVYIFIVLHLFCRKNNFSFRIFGQLSDFSDYRQQDQAGERVWLKDRYVQWVASVWNIGAMGRVRWGPENPGKHGCSMSCNVFYATIQGLSCPLA